MVLHGGFETFVVVGDYQLDAFEPPNFQRSEQLLIGRLTLGVRNLHRQDLPKTILAHRRDDQDSLAHYPVARPRLLVAGVHKEVGIGHPL